MADTERPRSSRPTQSSDGDARDVGAPSTAADREREGTTRTPGSPANVSGLLDVMRDVLLSASRPFTDAVANPAFASPGLAGPGFAGPAVAGSPAAAGGPVFEGGPGAYVNPQAGDAFDGWLLDTAHGPATDAPPESSTAAATRTGSRHRAGPRGGDHDEAETSRMMALVDLAKQGDAEAFGQLYDHYVSTIYRYIYYRVGTYALAEDLTSETFLRALRALASFKWQGRDFGAWLVTIARNLVADHYKSGRFRLEVATGEILDHDSVSDGPEDDVLASITNEALMQALRQLGSEQQECLVLRFLNGLSVAETALALGKSEGAIKQLQLRAIRNLAKQLPDGFR